jgi:hypothetical protein
MIRSFSFNLLPLLKGTAVRRGAIFGGILLASLVAFEIFNFSTTSFALEDVLGDLEFGGLRWATLLALAFCGIDFAGIARIMTPEKDRTEPAEVWYLFVAWLLAAAFNAVLTWWGVTVAMRGGASIGGQATSAAVPVLVAILVWLVRVLIIGTFSIGGERLFSLDTSPRPVAARSQPARMPFQPQVVRAGQGAAGASASLYAGHTARPAVRRPAGLVGMAERRDEDSQE